MILAHPDMLQGAKAEVLKKFLAVCARGYQYVNENPEDAANILLQTSKHESLVELGGLDYLIESHKYLTQEKVYLTDSGQWGVMDGKRWTDFIDWLCDRKCLTYRDGSQVPR